MALHIYQFRALHPGLITGINEHLQGGGATFVGSGGGLVVNVQVDDTKLADLSDYMAAKGFSLVATDPLAGSLTIREIDFWLENDPPSPGAALSIGRTSGLVTTLEWTRTGGNLMKRVQLTRSGGLVTQQVSTVFDFDGSTVIGQVTETWARSGSEVTSVSRVRNV